MTLPKRILKVKKIKPMICIMFDDGLPSDYTIAYHEMLELRGIKGVSNVPTGLVDTPDHLTWLQIEEMNSNGWGFGCHTHMHTRLTDLSLEQIHTSMQAVNAAYTLHGVPIPIHHVPPATVITPDRQEVVLQYRQAIHNVHEFRPVLNYKRTMNFANLGFTLIPHWTNTDMNTVDGLNKFKALIDEAVSKREVLMIVAHRLVDVLSEPYSPIELLRSQFVSLLDYGLSKGIQFATFNELYQYVNDYQTTM